MNTIQFGRRPTGEFTLTAQQWLPRRREELFPFFADAGNLDTPEERPEGTVVKELAVTHPGAYPLIEHGRHTTGTLTLEIPPSVRCHATCFMPGLA